MEDLYHASEAGGGLLDGIRIYLYYKDIVFYVF